MDTSMFHGSLVTTSRILYTPSAFARMNLIHLQETGSLQATKPHTSQRENLASYLFFLVCSGGGTLQYAGKTRPLRAGDCVFLDCRRPYSHRTSDDLWKLKWVHFYGPNMNSIYDKYTERGGGPCFHPKDPKPYDLLLNKLYETAVSEDHVRDMRIFERLTALLTLLMEDSWNPQNGRRNSSRKQNLQEIKEYLDRHYTERITLDHLADRFYINKFYLTRIFREQFGSSINNYLMQARVTHAKQLLRFTDKTIEAIGSECGIDDANYFSRMFRKVEGISPGEFRRMWQDMPTAPAEHPL